MEEKKNKINRAFKTILTMLLVFGLPALSWIFLKSGVDYRKDALSELGDLGKVADFQLENQNKQLISAAILHGRLAVVNFLSADMAGAKQATARIAKLHQSFNDTEDVLFLSFFPADSTVVLLDKATELGITDHKQWFLLGGNETELKNMATNIFKIENPANGVALVDTSLTIRNIYDINNNPAMGRLVEHMALIIPKQQRR